jgi:hypothetical protein
MNIFKRSMAVSSFLLFLFLAVVNTALGADYAKTGVNLAPVAEPSTSHVSRDTSLAALNDGYAPKVSHDRAQGSYGNWRATGTQWVQYDWTAPVSTKKVDVFWLDANSFKPLDKVSL